MGMPLFSCFFLSLSTEVSDLHLGRQASSALEEAGELQAGAAQRDPAQCRDCPGAEGRGERGEDDMGKGGG